jgi:hypothetical protein
MSHGNLQVVVAESAASVGRDGLPAEMINNCAPMAESRYQNVACNSLLVI